MAKGKGKAREPDKDPTQAIQASILQKMKRKDDQPNQAFILEADLKEAWEGHSLHSIFPLQNWTDEDRYEIQTYYRKTLSILIVISWQGLKTKLFRSTFFRQPGRKDRDLPLLINQLEFLGPAAHLFETWQHAFNPAIIEVYDRDHIQYVEPYQRLPFESEEEFMGSGSYGKVLKRSIARGCYHDKSQKLENMLSEYVVAVKIYHPETGKKAFFDEVERLNHLRAGVKTSERIMKHKSAVVHGDVFMTIFPVAELRDLDVFLREGHGNEPSTSNGRKIYNFDNEFEKLSNGTILHKALIRECSELSSALSWLHKNLSIFGKENPYIAHMDLKPDNILICREEGYSAGKWIISDFGVSLVGRRDIMKSKKTVDHRNRVGGYSPPEIGQAKLDGRKCDTWSFVCILCDVLAFALGRREGFLEFRNLRSERDDKFYMVEGSAAAMQQTNNGSESRVKPKILDWLLEKERTEVHSWVPRFIQIIYDGLRIIPEERADIQEISQGLNEINVAASGTTESRPTSFSISRPQLLEIPSEGAAFNNAESSLTASMRRSTATPLRTRNTNGENSPSSTATPADTSPRMGSLANGNDSLAEQLDRNQSSNSNGDINPTTEPSPEEHRDYEDILPLRGNNRHYTKLAPLSSYVATNVKPIAVELHKKGDHVAMLYKDYVLICPMGKNDSQVKKLVLPSITTTERIWTSSRFFAICIKSAGNSIEVHSIMGENGTRYFQATYGEKPWSHFAISDLDIAVCTYGHQALIMNLLSGESRVAQCVDHGSSIKAAEFSNDDNTLYIWAINSATAAVDIVCFYDVANFPPRRRGIGVYRQLQAENPSKNITLIPFSNGRACVIRETDGSMFVAQPLEESNSSGAKALPRTYTGMTNTLVACMARGNVLISVEKKVGIKRPRVIREYQLEMDQSGLLKIGQPGMDLGSVDHSIDNQARIAVKLIDDGRRMLLLCTSKGEVIKYLQQDSHIQ